MSTAPLRRLVCLASVVTAAGCGPSIRFYFSGSSGPVESLDPSFVRTTRDSKPAYRIEATRPTSPFLSKSGGRLSLTFPVEPSRREGAGGYWDEADLSAGWLPETSTPLAEGGMSGDGSDDAGDLSLEFGFLFKGEDDEAPNTKGTIELKGVDDAPFEPVEITPAGDMDTCLVGTWDAPPGCGGKSNALFFESGGSGRIETVDCAGICARDQNFFAFRWTTNEGLNQLTVTYGSGKTCGMANNSTEGQSTTTPYSCSGSTLSYDNASWTKK